MNAVRVSRKVWVLGAIEDESGGDAEEKLVMDQSTILFSLQALLRMRSPWKATQST